jgi:hypothetical protein
MYSLALLITVWVQTACHAYVLITVTHHVEHVQVSLPTSLNVNGEREDIVRTVPFHFFSLYFLVGFSSMC